MKTPPPPLQVVRSKPRPGTGRAYAPHVPHHAEGIKAWVAAGIRGPVRVDMDSRTPPPRAESLDRPIDGIREITPPPSRDGELRVTWVDALVVLGGIALTILLFGGSK